MRKKKGMAVVEVEAAEEVGSEEGGQEAAVGEEIGTMKKGRIAPFMTKSILFSVFYLFTSKIWIESLKATTAPVTIKLARAPELTKSEIAKFFSLPESDFDLTGSVKEEGANRYFLKFYTVETACKMVTEFAKNRVRLFWLV